MIVGPLVGGWLIHVASWRAIFFLNVPIAIATILIVMLLMPRPEAGGGRGRASTWSAACCARSGWAASSSR